ncbi:hypothetical protein QN277_024403 [Acacia crassicarpa]|uniref:Uncharacterized protein n=1 Tax=Acacia crassicarpa TaxID=499986 RepID=A0AAE1K9H4_9FABA|nr:hypothetical protein QN277_024403 [Acacia crassicarpa]
MSSSSASIVCLWFPIRSMRIKACRFSYRPKGTSLSAEERVSSRSFRPRFFTVLGKSSLENDGNLISKNENDFSFSSLASA